MHEMSIAVSIVDIVCKKAIEEDAKKINSIELEIGELSGIMIDALEFGFEAATKNTLADGALLKINKVQGKALCKNCDKHFHIEHEYTPCPTCNDFNFELLEGKELNIKSFNID